MRGRSASSLLLVLCLGLTGCGGVRQLSQAVTGDGPDPFAGNPAGEIPAHLRAGNAAGQARVRLAPMGEDPAAVERMRGRSAEASLLTPEEDIVWTDPDNPDADLPGIEDLIRTQEDRADWEESLGQARKIAMREELPLLVWFTDSERSTVCKTLSAELFSTPDFGSWAGKKLVRVRLDWNVKAGGGDMHEQMDLEARRRDYLENLARRYRVSGKPHVLVMAPDGTVTGRYRGYRKGSADFFWGQIKHASVLAARHHEQWAERMKKKGYRVWTSARTDFTSFARLARYRDGELVLVEPDGGRFKTREEHLSTADRLWIAQEKAKRR